MKPETFINNMLFYRPQEVKSTKFALMYRKQGGSYHFRSVNKDFEDRHIEMFKIVPPCVGGMISLECLMRIDVIEYRKDGMIVFWVSETEIAESDEESCIK